VKELIIKINEFLLLIYSLTGSCRKATSCPVSPWTAWTPSVNNGECKAQTRYQDKIPQTTFVSQLTNCNGIIPDCHPNRVPASRTFCEHVINIIYYCQCCNVIDPGFNSKPKQKICFCVLPQIRCYYVRKSIGSEAFAMENNNFVVFLF